MKKVLLCGFEPFGGESRNPSWEVAQQIAAAPPEGTTVTALRLPVIRFEAVARVIAAIEVERPELVIALGQAGGRSRVTPERIAINVDDYRSPDNAGNRPAGEPIVEGGPAAHWCTLPVKGIANAIQQAGIPAAISNSAGTYLCNHTAFGILDYLNTKALTTPAGFIHLPYLPEQALGKAGEVASMSLELMTEAIRIAIEYSLARQPLPAFAG